MTKAAITVLGAGAFGLSCAYVAARRGAFVRVIDPNGVGAGSSGGVVGALAPHTPESWNDKKEFQFQSLILARHFWPEVEQTAGLSSGYGNTGRVQALADARQLELAHQRSETAKVLWQGLAQWQVTRDAPEGLDSPTGWYVHDTLSARLHPAQACAALAGAIRALGGEVVPRGDIEGQVIHATGWQGLVDLSRALGKTVGTGVKGQAILFDLDARDMPQIYAQNLHIIPHADGTTAVGSTSQTSFDDPYSIDALADDLKARAIAAFPPLAGAKEIRRWAGVRPRAKSRAPMLGEHPVLKGQFIANGGFKIGFGMAPLAAQVLIDLVLEGGDAIPAAFKPQASL